jgi:hypothetical protein
MKNYQILLTSIISGWVFWAIVWGPLPTMIYFAGPENELGCAVIAGTMCILSLIGLDWKGFINYLNK